MLFVPQNVVLHLFLYLCMEEMEFKEDQWAVKTFATQRWLPKKQHLVLLSLLLLFFLENDLVLNRRKKHLRLCVTDRLLRVLRETGLSINCVGLYDLPLSKFTPENLSELTNCAYVGTNRHVQIRLQSPGCEDLTASLR